MHAFLITTLAAGAAKHAAADLTERAKLARDTARAVADAAADWAEAAVGIKQATGRGSEQSVLAEELATGPLGTLRLLLLTARSLADIAETGLPRLPAPPRITHDERGGDRASLVEIDVLPARGLWDGAIAGGQRVTVRCTNPGSVDAFLRTWQRECDERPRSGGVAAVLGAGNVSGLAVADAICQIFEHGRAALVKLHPVQEPLAPVLRRAVAPLVEAGLVGFVVGGPDVAREAVADAAVTHVHLTGGRAAFDAVAGSTTKPLTCELGNVTPWFIVPGRYTSAQLRLQADSIAASIANNTSFNCIATKLVVTCREWGQREEFLGLVRRRLESLPARSAWFPGSATMWEQIAGHRPPADGTLPWVFRTGIDPAGPEPLLKQEWFVPVAGEVTISAADIETFCGRAAALARDLPGSLAASVTIPSQLSTRDAARVELLLEHLRFGVVGVNCWAALAYALGGVPWGGFPGATLADPRSGIGFVHDPLMLPLVHNSILRGPLGSPFTPPWFPWHSRAARLAQGVIDMYGAIARGRSGLWHLLRMLPDVVLG
ncbi:MAG: aldehyde dehydrogenase family protein [Planctomycetia bacterium]